MLLAPLAVLPLAAAAAAGGLLARSLGWPSLLVGLTVVALLAVGTRALHLDGLADTVDGLASGRPAEQALAVMKRGDIGPMGVVALVLVLAGQAVAVGALLTGWSGVLAVAALVAAARGALLVACVRGVPAARPGGLGAAVANTVPRWAAAAEWLGLILLLGVVLRPGWRGLVVGVAGLLVAVGTVAWCTRRFGGVTGDVMGAAVELAFTAMVLVAV